MPSSPSKSKDLLPDILKVMAKDPFVISDTHFFDDKPFRLEPLRRRLAKTRVGVDRLILKKLKNSNPLLHLGDVIVEDATDKAVRQYATDLGSLLHNIKKILVIGNHDKAFGTLFRDTGWLVVSHGINLTVDPPLEYKDAPPFLLTRVSGSRVFFSHEPVLRPPWRPVAHSRVVKHLTFWFNNLQADINVHGHVHSKTIPHPLFCNVSAEVVPGPLLRVSHLVVPAQPWL